MNFSAHLIWRSRTFWVVIGLFALANVISALRPALDPACLDGECSMGFPFPFYLGVGDLARFFVFGALLDLVVAWTIAVLAVWLVRIVRRDR